MSLLCKMLYWCCWLTEDLCGHPGAESCGAEELCANNVDGRPYFMDGSAAVMHTQELCEHLYLGALVK